MKYHVSRDLPPGEEEARIWVMGSIPESMGFDSSNLEKFRIEEDIKEEHADDMKIYIYIISGSIRAARPTVPQCEKEWRKQSSIAFGNGESNRRLLFGNGASNRRLLLKIESSIVFGNEESNRRLLFGNRKSNRRLLLKRQKLIVYCFLAMEKAIVDCFLRIEKVIVDCF